MSAGEALDPVLPDTPAAQARGEIGAEHVKIIRRFFHQLPASVDYQTRELAEADLARVAAGLKPEELRQVADRLMMLVNPDGDFSDAERARRRDLTLGKQDADGMSKISGLLDPETRATTLQELESGTGHAVTGGGSLLPMTDVIRLAAHAHHYLAVFDNHTKEALYLGHTKRFASPAQRIVLHALNQGCTTPC